LNYFNYFTEIEDAFIRRRGKHLLLSSMDWALIESWKEMSIPLHIALRGIERAFDSWEAKPRKRTIKSLLYCQEEVEAQYAEWVESRLGAGSEETEAKQAEANAGTSDEGLPFSRATIVSHLQSARSSLLQARDKRQRTAADDLSEALERAAALLAELEQEFVMAALPNAEKLEDSLTGLERMLSDSILSVIASEQLNAVTAEVEKQLCPYRRHMDQAVYQQTRDNLLLKRLREQFQVPRLSLFYL